MTAGTGLALYDRAAVRGSAQVLDSYSTSFRLASRLCSGPVRADLAAIYALVRVADEIVDGCAADAGLSSAQCREVLDGLEREVGAALRTGYSANLVVHAFATTARATGIGEDLTRPFFASMRRDLSPLAFADERELDDYVHGSAEVIGLMCLASFRRGMDPDPVRDARWDRGAIALGSAFQRVNFLRDLGADADGLGRRYFPGIDPHSVTDAQRDRILDGIDAELAIAGAVIGELPSSSRRAVAAAHLLYSELSARLRRTPARVLADRRVRVPAPRKAALLVRAALRGLEPGLGAAR
ncbi:phytoene/squalene synthase family protein [Microbacterium azadirachtae]|uniref:phytoene/squalene synthase family protein n=1 Tax=Microbacterium azadirachtae TaxID=582680 RepID=UPI000884C94C|nr:squalene/phytoene synthase family protein [Microbacterium azadirachtae]SDM38412.1 Phytoene/squalene synthetase [Microbacterium azadirachtae]SEG54135.1 Phytoene/squalene synthetase [Microbacterium azadirachtae]SEG57005.1 Phytoene/squalene synthetase [Microbacterium azadirachtae]